MGKMAISIISTELIIPMKIDINIILNNFGNCTEKIYIQSFMYYIYFDGRKELDKLTGINKEDVS